MQRQKINKYINFFLENHAPKNYAFRRNQKETIINIVETYLDGKQKLLLFDAPTGSGKSHIAIISAYVLNKFGFTGYILTSDLTLQDQYTDDIAKLKLGWGSVKGIDNYECIENGEKHSLGECKMKNIASNVIKQLDCYRECPYFFARDHGSISPTAILNYSLYLIHMNYVLPRRGLAAPFNKRDFVICDEAHKVLEIVQKHFSPTINEETYPRLERLRQFLAEQAMSIAYSGNDIRSMIQKITDEESLDKLFMYNKQFEKMLVSFVDHANEIKKFIGRKYNSQVIPREWQKGLSLCEYVKDIHCKFKDYNQIINSTDIRAMIKNQNGNNIQFNCINERYLMKKHFHDLINFNIMMSATIGEPVTFIKSIKGSTAKYIRLPSTFDFKKSPIIVYQGQSMSFRNKDNALPILANKIDEIIEKHKGQNGIIHSGSYANSNYFKEYCNSKRIITYDDSNTKKEMLFNHNAKDDKVLMGPSLLEGLDMKDDKSRFQIFAKVPYPSLVDKYIKAKLKVDPTWYNYKTITSILQGIGRSVRHEEDWAITYILDSDFMNLWRRNIKMFPTEFNDRLIFARF